MAEERTDAWAEQTQKALEEKYSAEAGKPVKVHKFKFFAAKDDIAWLFVKEPDRFAKMQVMDLSVQSLTQAGNLLIQTCAVQEGHSDPRFFDENQENDKLWLGAIMKASELVQFALADVKKK